MSSFCRENSINYWTFRENKKKREATTKASTKSKKLVRISPALKALEPEASPITIILPDNIKLLIPDHFNAKTLQKIISTLAAI